MQTILLAWLGMADLKAAEGEPNVGVGPIAHALSQLKFDKVVLLSDHGRKTTEAYCDWLEDEVHVRADAKHIKLSKPTAYGEIYEAAVKVIKALLNERNVDLTFHLSPGTPAMAAVWLLISKTRYPATLIESSIQGGVQQVSVPFEISAEFLPDYRKQIDRNLENVAEGTAIYGATFRQIVHRCLPMQKAIEQARRMAAFQVPILIEGESGTGKELFAQAIHNAGLKEKPFIAVNCDAIPPALIESEMFGHRHGAFTGATESRLGFFRSADGGTLFLDEVGELPLEVQVRLLRAIQEKEVVPVGESRPVPVNVRIISATHRNLLKEVQEGRFREDLFYRLAVGILRLPPLREREGDLTMLTDYLLEQINIENSKVPGYTYKKLSPSAKNLVLAHNWPGNVRELNNTLLRAALWSSESTISGESLRQSLLVRSDGLDILNLPMGQDFSLDSILGKVARDYIERALSQSGGNKSKAAKLLGFKSHQTLTNWMKRTVVNGAIPEEIR